MRGQGIGEIAMWPGRIKGTISGILRRSDADLLRCYISCYARKRSSGESRQQAVRG